MRYFRNHRGWQDEDDVWAGWGNLESDYFDYSKIASGHEDDDDDGGFSAASNRSDEDEDEDEESNEDRDDEDEDEESNEDRGDDDDDDFALLFDQNVTSDAIFGSGNDNGSFTINKSEGDDDDGGVELGLRAKLRFDENNQAQNIFNSNDDGTYTFENDVPSPGFGFAANSLSTPVWNFEWSINTNFDGAGGNLDDFTYLLEIDGDPGKGTDFGSIEFDPINVPFADHAIGDNATPNGGGTEATTAAEYADLVANNNVAQNSWNFQFFNETSDGLFLKQLEGFMAADTGTYTIQLSAFEGDDMVAQTAIDIVVVDDMMLM